MFKILDKSFKVEFNRLVSHPLQSWQWGEFRIKIGQKPFRIGRFSSDGNRLIDVVQIFLKKVPLLPFYYAYVPKCGHMDQRWLQYIDKFARSHKVVFVKFEPEITSYKWPNIKGKIQKEKNIVGAGKLLSQEFKEFGLHLSSRKVFDKYSFVLDLQKSKEELLQNMHHKARYNIRLAKRKGVKIKEMSNIEGLNIFLELNSQTTERQKFYLHNNEYFKQMWKIFGPSGIERILVAKYKEHNLAAWILFKWEDVLYYPYGASSDTHRNLMASNLIAWEAVQLGKNLGCKKFDFWGSLGPKPDKTDSKYGFHRFKKSYGAELVELVGTWDLVQNTIVYVFLNIADKIRWSFLRLRKSI